MKYKLDKHQVHGGKLVLTIKKTWLGIPWGTVAMIQTDKVYTWSGQPMWLRLPDFLIPGSVSEITYFCNSMHEKLLHERVYDQSNNILIKPQTNARTRT